MDAQRTIMVANESPQADQIRSRLSQRTHQKVFCCSYEHCRQYIAWHKNGIVVLLANDGDEEVIAAERLVQEARLRRSPLTMALIETGSPSKRLSDLDPYVACRVSWPDDQGEIERLIRSMPSSSRLEEAISDQLTNRLMLQTPSLLPQVARLALAAAHDVTVLLTGETGTGKTYLARLLHEHSPRRHHPFLMVPCGAQPSNLFESTFFGHVKGAYTGADKSRIGRFAAAGKGTILLDEIDALALEQQASLLRVIETGEYELVGDNDTRHSEARIIVASNCELAEEVAKGVFRQDLFYRLNVMSFHLAPLRKRRSDIPLLSRSIVARFNAKFGKELFDISSDVLSVLEGYQWPGNIRQLENVLQEAVLVSSGRVLTLRDLPELPSCEESTFRLVSAPSTRQETENGHGNNGSNGQNPSATLLRGRADYERGLIQKTLADCNSNRSRAARALGISRVTLYKKLRQYGLVDRTVG